MSSRIPQEHKDAMVDSYLAGKSSIESAKLFGYSYMSCLNELKTRGISARASGQYRTYTLDDNFFDIVDTEEKSYWLGFITADGNVYKNKLTISLAIKDKVHLEKFMESIKYNGPLRYTENILNNKIFYMCRAEIGSQKMVRSLLKLGITPNKTFVVKPYNEIPEELKRHYWRGVVDGDGCLYRRNDKNNLKNIYWEISLCGNNFIIEGFANWVDTFLPNENQFHKIGNIYSIKYCNKNSTKKLIEKLYSNANMYLNRKMDLALEVM